LGFDMSFGTRIFNTAGKLAFSTEYKTFVYQEKLFPVVFTSEDTVVATDAHYCTSPGLTGPVFPFVATPDNTATAVTISKYNPLGTTCVYSTKAQTSSSITVAYDDYNNVAWPRIAVGQTIKTPGGQTATVLAVTSTGSISATLTLNQAVTLAVVGRLYVVGYIGSYYIRVAIKSTVLSPSAAGYPLRVFTRNIPNSTTGHGATMFDASGVCVFNSNYPVLTLAATVDMPSGTANNQSISSVAVSSGSIPSNYSVFSPSAGRLILC
jgi:hypothetical protein